MKQIVVEFARVNWKGEYCVIQYQIVDTIDTAEFLIDNALNEYRDKPNVKISKENERIWEIETKCEITNQYTYNYFAIRERDVSTKEDVINAINVTNNVENKSIELTEPVFSWL